MMDTCLQDQVYEFDEAMDFLVGNGVWPQVVSLQHLKVGPVNYWPCSRLIKVDDEIKERPEKGVNALRSLLIERGLAEESGSESVWPGKMPCDCHEEQCNPFAC